MVPLLRRVGAAVGALLLLAAASWLPARAVQTAARPGGPPQAETIPPPVDIARPALAVPATIPVRAHSALGAVRAYFFTLAWAANVEGQNIGSGEAPYAAAYAYLDPGWRARLPFEKFVAGWKGVAHLDLLQAVDAGPVPYNPKGRRVYVEVREYLVLPHWQAIGFADGIFTTQASSQGWWLSGGGLQPEDVVTSAFGGAAARRDPAVAARAFVAAETKTSPASGKVERNGHLATVVVTVPARPGVPGRVLRVHLAQRVDGTWAPLYAERIG